MSAVFRVVLDTNVLRAALWSSKGASFRLVSRLPIPNVTVLLSVPLFSKNDAPGSTTLANFAVSLMKISCAASTSTRSPE